MGDVNDAGSVEIVGDEVLLISLSGGQQNIWPQVTGMSIYESVFENCLSCEIHIEEGQELLNKFPMGINAAIRAEEKVKFTIRTPGHDPTSYEFFVDAVVNVEKDHKSEIRKFSLRCCTEDFLNNFHKQFSFKYDIDTDAAVTDVIKIKLGSSKPLEVQPTKGIFDHLIGNLRPFQVIDLLTERAIPNPCAPKNYYSGYYVFFENKKGYHFVTVEDLFKQLPVAIYRYNTEHRTDIKEVNLFNILSINFPRLGHNVDKLRNGRIKSITRRYDVFRGTFKEYEYDDLAEHPLYIHADPDGQQENFNTPTFCGKFSGQSVQYYTAYDSSVNIGKKEDFHDEVVGRKRAFSKKMSEHGLSINVHGYTNLTAGNMIYLDFPWVAGTTSVRQKGPRYKGKYLVSSIKHIISGLHNSQTGPTHFMTLKLDKSNIFKG